MERSLKLLMSVVLLLAPAASWATDEPVDSAPGPVDSRARAEAYYHMMRASMAAQRGAVRELVAELRQAAKMDPGSAELRAEGATLLLSLGQFVEAEKMARDALEIAPERPEAVRLLAEMATRRALRDGDERSRAEAIRLYTILASGPEGDADAWTALARLKFDAGDLDGAVAAARELAEVRRGDWRVVQMIAQMYLTEDRRSEALETLLGFLVEFGSAEAIAPQIVELARSTGEWGRVREACTSRLEAQPDSPVVYRLRGEARLQAGDAAGAVDDLTAAVGAGVDDPMVLLHLTTAYGELGRLADAADAARSLARLLPDNANVKAMLGDVLARQGDWAAALEALDEALEGFNGEEGSAERRDVLRRRMAAIHLERDETGEARAVLGGLENPDETPSLELAARVAVAGNRLDRARAHAQQLRASGERGAAAMIEGEVLVAEGRLGRAEEQFRRALSELGPMASGRIAEIWRTRGRPDRGERLLREWVRDEPDSAEALFGLGGYLERVGRYEEAEAALQAALELEPEHANALNYLGYTLADRGVRLQEALRYVERALVLDPWNGAYLDSLGWVYFRMERFEEARAALERAAREMPGDPVVLEHLGDVYRELELHELAVGAWRRALNARPEDPEKLRGKIATEEARLLQPETRQ